MTMQALSLNQIEFETSARMFAPEVEHDPWIAWHGTSSPAQDSIERDGFRWMTNLYSKAEILELVDVFRQINWFGTHADGVGVLASFTLKSDFGTSDSKPIYFAETSWRAALYASREWAGGETARAVRLAFDDLDMYLGSADVRQAFPCGCDDWRCVTEIPAPAKPRNSDWLRQRVHDLQPLRDRCWAHYKNSTAGVVYAVRFEPDDAAFLRYNAGGVAAFRPVPASRIVAKVILPSGYSRPDWTLGDPNRPWDILMERRSQCGGVLAIARTEN